MYDYYLFMQNAGRKKKSRPALSTLVNIKNLFINYFNRVCFTVFGYSYQIESFGRQMLCKL